MENVVFFRKTAFSFKNFMFSFQKSVWFQKFLFHFRNTFNLQNSAILLGNVVSISECGLNLEIQVTAVQHRNIGAQFPHLTS